MRKEQICYLDTADDVATLLTNSAAKFKGPHKDGYPKLESDYTLVVKSDGMALEPPKDKAVDVRFEIDSKIAFPEVLKLMCEKFEMPLISPARSEKAAVKPASS